MSANEAYYEDTVLEHQIPWPNLGRILDADDPRYREIRDLMECSDTYRFSELGRAVEGRLLHIDAALRDEVTENTQTPLEADVVAAVRWRLGDDTEAESIHVLTNGDLAELKRSSIAMLLDAVANDPRSAGLAADHPVRPLIREWRRREQGGS